MKKYFVVLAALAMVFAGCKHEDSEYTSIFFKEKSLELAIGETKKLSVRWEPTSITTAPKCEWASSDEAIVSVDQNGNIQALAEGEANITAKSGELTAVCQVSVKSIFDMLVWSEFGLFDYDDENPIGEPYIVTSSKGTEYTAHLFPGTWYLWDENIQYVDGSGLSGAGLFAEIQAPVELVEYNGQYALWTNELIFSDASPADSAGVCPAGALTDAEEWYKYITDTLYKGDGSFKGAPIHYMDFDNKEYYYFQGFIKDGWLGEYYDGEAYAYYYQMNITWLGGVYGLELNETEDDFAQPAVFAGREDKYYELLPENTVAPAAMPRNIKAANNAPARRKGISKEAMKVFKLK